MHCVPNQLNLHKFNDLETFPFCIQPLSTTTSVQRVASNNDPSCFSSWPLLTFVSLQARHDPLAFPTKLSEQSHTEQNTRKNLNSDELGQTG
jgi:hypothetical protein